MGYQIELRHFKYFLAVAEELHYRKAGRKAIYIATWIEQTDKANGRNSRYAVVCSQ